MEDREAQNRAEEQPARPSHLRRLLRTRFATRKRAALALLGTIAGFHVVAWAVLEASGQVQYSCYSFTSRLVAAPGEIMVQALCAPFVMSYAIPALLYRGNLFRWDPGWFTTEILPFIYWPILVTAAVALLWSRRIVWWMLVVHILLATALRLGQLLRAGLTVT